MPTDHQGRPRAGPGRDHRRDHRRGPPPARRRRARPGLSLRAVARELGMVSSGIYRYVASRDELLTMLIIEAYDALGATGRGGRRRDRSASRRRTGSSPPPGPSAPGRSPTRTSTPSSTARRCPATPRPPTPSGPPSRVTLALAGIVVDAHRAGSSTRPRPSPVDVTAGACGPTSTGSARRSTSTCPTTSSCGCSRRGPSCSGSSASSCSARPRNVDRRPTTSSRRHARRRWPRGRSASSA